ncbi:hypothetical protein Sru01_49900 [Sphaerisporangium rufum]|uniref:Ketosynthase family 3 (KS3) domain-containing protein n=1 Tax=Sphaerisporangium rufum TaxID=1381558 RepID=A0A919V3F1_9ACTN|nr:polyketide synthase [Sphaerisporangium rufum]GII80008.1 hypothetical protein Sru01_49900 [Sphaerisporangium rufum]
MTAPHPAPDPASNATSRPASDPAPGPASDPAPGPASDAAPRPASDPAQGLARAAAPRAAGRGASGPPPVAVVGLACRVPGGDGPDELWRTLVAGRLRTGPVPADRLDGYDPDIAGTGGGRAALLADPGSFDLDFFRIGRRMAVWMDPQQRMLLETSWHALESAGIPPSSLAGTDTAVFAAAATADFRERMIRTGTVDRYAAVGSLSTYLANRLSHHYDLRGPSVTLDTACSSGLSALALAVSGLRAGEFGTALVGAANLCAEGWYFAAMSMMGALSPSGVCRPFSADADGYVRGEGALCLVLRRLDDALAAGDPVLAVIRGVALNHDGRAGGLTRTDTESQARLLRRALDQAGLAPADLGYLEAHAPGTRADVLEVEAVRRLLAAGGAPARFGGPGGGLWMGSAKAVVGHLEAAAGLASLAKAVLVLVNQAIPVSTGVLRFDGGAEPAATAVTGGDVVPWPRVPGRPRLLGVSSFGIGGSNAHVVLAEAPEPGGPAAAGDGGRYPVPVSGTGPDGLRAVAARLAEFLAGPAAPALPATAWTLQTGRDHLAARAVVPAASVPELVAGLRALAAGGGPPEPDGSGLPERAAAAAREWQAGGAPDWAALWDRPPARVRLPGYPFARVPLGFVPGPRPATAAR